MLTSALLGNIDIHHSDSVDSAFMKFITTILGIHERDISKHISKVYLENQDVRVFANSDSKKMMTLVRQKGGDKKLLDKGDLETLFYQ